MQTLSSTLDHSTLAAGANMSAVTIIRNELIPRIVGVA